MKIFRISNILSLAIATFFGILLFWTSQAVQTKEDELSSSRKNLTQELETIRVLSVEWDYLNRPQRLEKLAKEQLGMELPSAKEVVSDVAQIPEPAIPASDLAQYQNDGRLIPVSASAPKQTAKAKKPETVEAVSADKESFYTLIQNLDNESGSGQ